MRVYKRGNTYSFIFEIKQNGKRKSFSCGGYKSVLDANYYLKMAYDDFLMGKFNRDKYKPQKDGSFLNFTSFGYVKKKYLEYKKTILKPSSLMTETQAINSLDKFINADKSIEEINTHTFVQEFVNEMPYYKIIALNKLLDYAYKHLNVINKNVLDTFKINKNNNKVYNTVSSDDKYINDDDIKVLLNSNNPIFNVACKLMYYSGLRVGELLALTNKNITVSEDCITIDVNKTMYNGVLQEPKTKNSKRKIALPIFLKNDIMQLMNNDKMYMFDKKDITIPSEIKKTLPNFTYHSLRHTHASNLLSSGVSIAEVQKRMGHANAMTTLNVYNHCIQNNNKTLLEKIKEVI